MKHLPLVGVGFVIVVFTAEVHSKQWTPSRSTKLSVLALRGGRESSFPYELNPNYEPTPTQLASAKLKSPFGPPGGYMENRSQPPSQTEYFVSMQTYGTNPWGSSHNPEYASVVDSTKRYCSLLFQNNPTIAYVAISCVVISLLWRVQSFQPILDRYFVCSKKNFREGRVPVLLLSAISHVSWIHLFFNLATLLSLGPTVQSALASTGSPLWPLMLGAAVVSSTAYLALGPSMGCLGLSGVTLALVAMQARLFPRQIMGIQLFGIFPVRMPAHVLLNVLLTWSALGSLMRKSSVAHVTHLGGLLFGMAYHEYWRNLKR